ncbi:MAG: PD-(D/E)XK nuclease family protein, partial [Eubacterium sp.]|nr:PD-(D/E)XK nuclease family protein [Eubacterium sp.]
SVSQVKLDNMPEDETGTRLFKHEEELYVPSFAGGHKEHGGTSLGALRGTAVHKFLSLMDFESVGSAEDIKTQLNNLLAAGRMSEEESGLIDMSIFSAFVGSGLFAGMKRAAEEGRLRRESPFVMTVSASEVSSDYPADEKVLIQGIMDAYYTDDDGITLIDYKTDKIKAPEELIDRYRVQMQLYARALESGTGRKVHTCVLYSFCLGEEINVALSD